MPIIYFQYDWSSVIVPSTEITNSDNKQQERIKNGKNNNNINNLHGCRKLFCYNQSTTFRPRL